MVCAPSLLPTRPTGQIVWDHIARRPSDLGHQASSCWAPIWQCGRGEFRKFTFRIIAGAAGRRCGPGGAVRMMSGTPAEQPSVAAKNGNAENPIKTVRVIIKGKVQGVYYRNWTVDAAQQVGVNGWVRNLKAGSVEAVFSGKSAVVDSLIQKCHQGPSAARVSSVEASLWKEEVPQGFGRKPTIW